MNPGSRRIRVACPRCGVAAIRTLAAGDDRSLEVLSRISRCGECRARATQGLVRVELVSPVAGQGRKRTAQRSGPVRPRQDQWSAAVGKQINKHHLGSTRAVHGPQALLHARAADQSGHDVAPVLAAILAGCGLAACLIGAAYRLAWLGDAWPYALAAVLVAGAAIVTLVPIARAAIGNWDWRAAGLALGGLALGACLFVALSIAGRMLAEAMDYEIPEQHSQLAARRIRSAHRRGERPGFPSGRLRQAPVADKD